MPDATLSKLIGLLKADHPEAIRSAAAVVLGEIGAKDAPVGKALVALMRDADAAVRLEVIRAVGKLRVTEALPQLLESVSGGGIESELAAQAAARLGEKGTKALRELMGRTAPGLRRRIASALAAGGTASSETAALNSILDADPGVVDAATRSFIDRIPNLPATQRKHLVDEAINLLKPGKGKELQRSSEAALLRLLAALGDPRGETTFWARIDEPHPPELRAIALQALGKLPRPTQRDKVQRLLQAASAADFQIAAPALMILKSVAVVTRNLADWIVLFDAPDPTARHFAIEKLADFDKPEVASALLQQLKHPDSSLHQAALGALARMEHGREALAEALLEAPSPRETWELARAQAPSVSAYSSQLRDKLLAQAFRFLEAGDARADALLWLLREADARGLRDRLEAKALGLRKKKNYSLALVYLRLLTRDPASHDALRFEHAACGLQLSPHDLGAEARITDPCLQQFAGLIHRHETDPLEFIEKATWIEPEALFYLGFHFAEGKGPEREFGGKVLRLFIRRHSKSKLTKDARSKLRSESLPEKGE